MESSQLTDFVFIAFAVVFIVFIVHTISNSFKKHPENADGQNITQVQIKNKIFYSIWFWWVLTSIIYFAFNSIGYPGSVPSLGGYLAGLVGLFVPYGQLSAILLVFSPFSWISVVVFFVLMSMAEKELNKKNYSLSKRIIANLIILLLLTIAVDAVRGTFFASWIIFLQGSRPF